MVVCRQCDKQLSTIQSLNRHVREVHHNPRYTCENCGKMFRRSDALKIHTSAGKCFQLGETVNDQISSKSVKDLPMEEDVYSEGVQCGGSLHLNRIKQAANSTGDEADFDSEDHEDDYEMEDDEDCASHVQDSEDSEDSSEDSDNFDESSDSENSTDSEDGDENSHACCEPCKSDEGTHCDDPELDGESEDQTSQETPSDPKHGGFARWRSSENGYYVFWKSHGKTPYVVQHREWLSKLLGTPYKLQKQLIQEASHSQLDALREIATNLLQGRVAIHIRALKAMAGKTGVLRLLASEESSYKTLRRTLQKERDEMLPILLLNAIPSSIKSRKAIFR